MRRKATPEQIAKAKEKRAKVRDIAKKIAAMSETERAAMVQNWPTTIEGHALSAKNACLIAYQTLGGQGATVLGGFRQWKKAGRFVRKGEGGMSIWIPLMRKTKDANGDEINEEGERPNFGLATVFDISQTEETQEAIVTGGEGVILGDGIVEKIPEVETPYYHANKASIDALTAEPEFALAIDEPF